MSERTPIYWCGNCQWTTSDGEETCHECEAVGDIIGFDEDNRRIADLEAENERLREATDEAKTALADALHGEVGGFARLSVSYARSSLNKIQALESEAGP